MNKTFIIDFDDPKDLKKTISLLQKRRKALLREIANYEQISFGTSKLNFNDIFDIFELLWNIQYSGKCGGDYYVYYHCNPRMKLSIKRDVREAFIASKFGISYKPIYVGKGTGNRCYDLKRNDSHRKIRTQLIENGLDLQSVKILENLSEEEALFHEQKMICLLGIISLDKQGMLTNLQTDKKQEVIDCFYKTINEFEFKEERIKIKALKLIKLMSSWS